MMSIYCIYALSQGGTMMLDFSFNSLLRIVCRWLHEIEQNCEVVTRLLVGNKNDDPDRKVVLTEDARRFADQMGIQGQ